MSDPDRQTPDRPSQHPRRGVWACALGLVWLLVGCGAVGPDLQPSDPAYKDPARRAYYDGMRELVAGDYIKAATIFQAVATSPRHVKYATLAKLRLGDSFFFQGRWAEAAEVYRGFVQQHPSDPNLPYARFKVAECQYQRIPGEWLLSPPAHEFDQTLTIQAEAEIKGFLTLFPTSQYARRAREMLAEVRNMLLKTELYAANFYAERQQWQAVAWRLDYAIDVYPEIAVREDLVWRLADAWQRVDNKREAVSALTLFVKRFPEAARHEEAQRRLEALTNALKNEPSAQPKAATPPVVEPPRPPADPDTDKVPSEEEPGEPDDDKLELKPLELPKLAPDTDG